MSFILSGESVQLSDCERHQNITPLSHLAGSLSQTEVNLPVSQLCHQLRWQIRGGTMTPYSTSVTYIQTLKRECEWGLCVTVQCLLTIPIVLLS